MVPAAAAPPSASAAAAPAAAAAVARWWLWWALRAACQFEACLVGRAVAGAVLVSLALGWSLSLAGEGVSLGVPHWGPHARRARLHAVAPVRGGCVRTGCVRAASDVASTRGSGWSDSVTGFPCLACARAGGLVVALSPLGSVFKQVLALLKMRDRLGDCFDGVHQGLDWRTPLPRGGVGSNGVCHEGRERCLRVVLVGSCHIQRQLGLGEFDAAVAFRHHGAGAGTAPAMENRRLGDHAVRTLRGCAGVYSRPGSLSSCHGGRMSSLSP